MRLVWVVIPLILIFSFAMIPTVFALCDSDEPCDYLYLILNLNTTQIEKINEIKYYVSEVVTLNSPAYEISFHDVKFSVPYTHDPPRHIYSDVTFPDGTKETLSILFDEPGLSKHVSPQAGFVGKPDGYTFLVSFNEEPEPYIDPDHPCPPGLVLDWDICVEQCPSGTPNENGICPPNCGPNTFLNEIGVCELIDGGCEPDINGNTTWCGTTYDHWKIFFSSPAAMIVVFGILGLIVGVPIVLIYYIRRKRK